jgi:hypothetical protein
MTTWIYRPNHPQANENGMVPKHLVGYEPSNAPYVISDNMAPMKHMATGEVMDSKARFRQATRAAGCVEIGNEPIINRAPEKLDGGKRRDDIRKAIYDLRNGR